MNKLNSLGWDDFYDKNLSESDKNEFDIARVISEHKNSFIVTNSDAEFRAIISGKFFYNIETGSDMPVVGDWVLCKKDSKDPIIIEKIVPRKTTLTRRAPSDRRTFGNNGELTLVSNVDIIFIVSSLNQNFNLSRIERLLALVYASGAMPVILLSKADLCIEANEKKLEVESIAFGVPVLLFSSLKMQNIDEIMNFIEPGKTACLIGSSGVGKTTLMNILCERVEKTVAIRETDGRGRHATTGRALYILPNGGMLIDTPGIREIGLTDDIAGIDTIYEDIESLAIQCRFRNCTHTNDDGCAIRHAIETGELDERRLKNYTKMQREALYAADKKAVMINKQAINKKFVKWQKSIK